MDQIYDVAVVGAGPIGLELAVALKRAGANYVQFDARQIGYTISWFPPQTRFFSSNDRIALAGVPLQTWDQSKATREEYLTYLRRIVEEFDLDVRTYEPVARVRRTGAHFQITTRPASGESRTLARNIVFVTGGTARPRMLNIPGEDLPHVSHYFGDPHTYFRRRVLVVGGKNSAVEAALRCHHAGARVAISYRRARFNDKSIKYWLMPEIDGLIRSGKIDALFESRPVSITPTHVTLELNHRSIESSDHWGSRPGAPGNDSMLRCSDDSIPTIDVPADFVLLLTGYEADMDLLRDAGVPLTGPSHCPVYDPETMETSVPGIYVAGTAVGGTQEKYTVFIENCHVHVERIIRALTGQRATVTRVDTAGREES